jgi:hypothetical protein
MQATSISAAIEKLCEIVPLCKSYYLILFALNLFAELYFYFYRTWR